MSCQRRLMSCCSFTAASSHGTQPARRDPEVQSLRREVDCLTQWLSTAREYRDCWCWRSPLDMEVEDQGKDAIVERLPRLRSAPTTVGPNRLPEVRVRLSPSAEMRMIERLSVRGKNVSSLRSHAPNNQSTFGAVWVSHPSP